MDQPAKDDDEPTVRRSELPALLAKHPELVVIQADNGEFAALNKGVSDDGEHVQVVVLGRIVD